MMVLVSAALAAAPFLMIWGLLWLSDRVALRRQARYARQIALTDAIHRELGAVAAPTVERRPGGRWRVAMAVWPDRPATVGALVRITDSKFVRWDGAGAPPVEIVITPSRDGSREARLLKRVARQRAHRLSPAARPAVARETAAPAPAA